MARGLADIDLIREISKSSDGIDVSDKKKTIEPDNYGWFQKSDLDLETYNRVKIDIGKYVYDCVSKFNSKYKEKSRTKDFARIQIKQTNDIPYGMKISYNIKADEADSTNEILSICSDIESQFPEVCKAHNAPKSSAIIVIFYRPVVFFGGWFVLKILTCILLVYIIWSLYCSMCGFLVK